MRKLVTIAAGLLLMHLILHEKRKRQPTINYVDKLPLNFNAFTLPPAGIFVKKDQQVNMELLNHELIHWKQYQRMGLLPYYYNFLKGYLVSGYDLHPMELEARANESEYCKTHYTSCVRDGKAKTVVNPLFRT